MDLFGKAAFGLVALVAAHPFADGNGRVARLAMNFLLLKHRLPFVICLCPTPELRSRQNELVRGVLDGQPIRALSEFIALQCAQAWNAADEFFADKRRLRCEEMSVTVPKLLERVKRQLCMICLAEKPDMAALCCGCPVHMSCIAEWLSSNSSCVQCRGTLTLPPKPPQLAAPGMDPLQRSGGVAAYLWRMLQDRPRDPSPTQSGGTPASADDETNEAGADGIDSVDAVVVIDTPDDTARALGDLESTTDSSTDTFVSRPARCRICSNIAATTCSNGSCGRCCETHFQFNGCVRHGSCF